MARRKNMKRRREILGNTFRLIREKGLENVSLQMIAERSNISKSLLQSYYPHKARLINDIARNLLTTLSKEVDKYDDIDHTSSYAHMKAFIYTIFILGSRDEGLDRIISQAITANDSLDNWGDILFNWIQETNVFDGIKATEDEIESGITFITVGVGRLYHERKKHHLTPEDLSNYATSSLMYSFCHAKPEEIEQALRDGHRIIASADMINVHRAIDHMFDEDKEIIS
ncbi:TetR/AcrR family transcriptional regulator [Lactobacillus gigeriorum]|uniref:Transcriptional regulator n=1 Tax=Lactobacillus gigeriorum DSM 23908 = CRBIP 24.85 TaxID=1423751 RepID=I7J282_9LACO|nr:TetR/AcrR family transcriptional regulator [Lactobacillus gigeriorum]KRN13769.1 transcriptional regulator [Lactobacillus gigeriorum DSM 23908 = CRBIP 24.85]CCI86737.1 Transcriptional regulator [Lactobacillus gigeriorum DSM 23908 = CRBIP 24.85]